MITPGGCGLKLGGERVAQGCGSKQTKSSREMRRERHDAPCRYYSCRGPSILPLAGSQDELKSRPTKTRTRGRARLSSSGATQAAQTHAARAPDAMQALVDAPPEQACWRAGSAEDARHSPHPSPWWAE